MSLEVAELGAMVADFMDEIEAEYGSADEIELGIAAVVAEVKWKDDRGEVTAVTFRCTEGRRWIQRALFAEAIAAVCEATVGVDELDDDEDE